MKWLTVRLLAEKMSHMLPFEFGISPALAISGLSTSKDESVQAF
jgi:hypothetical protein